MPFQNITYEKAERIAILTLQRPERLNALDRAMAQDCIEALTDFGQDQALRVLLLTGAGSAFCGGADIQALDPGAERPLGDLVNGINQLVLTIRNLPKPVIAVVNGAAVGAGVSLALACDLCLASSTAVFRLTFAGLGLVPDGGLSWLLPRLLGWQRAMEWALGDEPLSAQQALDWGLINRVPGPEALREEAWQRAEKLAHGPALTWACTKTLFQQGLTTDLARQMEQELAAQRECARSADYREGLAALAEKRKPKFQ